MDVIGYLEPEDLKRFREFTARMEAMKIKPHGYDREEVEAAMLEQYELHGALSRKYDLEDTEYWRVNVYTGAIMLAEG
jgi:hypothetical protein